MSWVRDSASRFLREPSGKGTVFFWAASKTASEEGDSLLLGWVVFPLVVLAGSLKRCAVAFPRSPGGATPLTQPRHGVETRQRGSTQPWVFAGIEIKRRTQDCGGSLFARPLRPGIPLGGTPFQGSGKSGLVFMARRLETLKMGVLFDGYFGQNLRFRDGEKFQLRNRPFGNEPASPAPERIGEVRSLAWTDSTKRKRHVSS